MRVSKDITLFTVDTLDEEHDYVLQIAKECNLYVSKSRYQIHVHLGPRDIYAFRYLLEKRMDRKINWP